TTAAAKGYAPFEPQLGHSPITVWARAGVALDDVTIYLTPAIELTVVVQDQKGQPLASAEVRAFDERRGSAEVRAVISDDKGVARRDVRAGSRDVELRLGAATALLRGNVRDGHDKPVVAFSVVARLREGLAGRGPEERATVIDPEGHYELALAPGRYEVAAAA